MTPAEFEPATPASQRSQTHALDRAVTAIGSCLPVYYTGLFISLWNILKIRNK